MRVAVLRRAGQPQSGQRWVRSSRCGPTGDNCVEVNLGPALIGVRDSKAGDRARLFFAREHWTAFLALAESWRHRPWPILNGTRVSE
jgi:hypothetical protein